MKNQRFLAASGLALVLSALVLTGCPLYGEDPEQHQLPDPKYLVSDDDKAAPVGAEMISEEEFASLYAEGKLHLAGPEAERETTEREAKQDQEDIALIDAYQKANPNSPDMLPQLSSRLAAGVTPSGDGNFQLQVKKNGRIPVESHITMGQRFRIRSLARSIREFNTKENQLRIYAEFDANLPADVKAQLQLDTYANVEKLPMEQIKLLNDRIAVNWEWIISYVEPEFEPILPPSCDTNVGNGDNGDQVGNTCSFKADGIMMNHNWKGKQHITCVKNQAARGSCPAFSTISTMEYNVHKKYGTRVNLSEQAYYAMLKLVWGPNQHIGDGSWPAWGIANSYNSNYLVPFEDRWNYNPALRRRNNMAAGADMMLGTNDDVLVSWSDTCLDYDETCSDTSHMSYLYCANVLGIGTFCGYFYPSINSANTGYRFSAGATNYWDPANRNLSLAKMILAVGLFKAQVIWGFDVENSSWGVDSNGFVTFSSATETASNGAHAVHVVGLITNSELADILPNAPLASGGGYFIVKNSWANCWGDGGYAYVPYDSVKAYSLEMMSAPGVQ